MLDTIRIKYINDNHLIVYTGNKKKKFHCVDIKKSAQLTSLKLKDFKISPGVDI